MAREMVIDALPRRAADTERFRVLTIWLHTCLHRAHTGTRRSTSRGSPRGVALLVLSPSASPEREFSCTPLNLMSVCSRRTFRYLTVAVETACKIQSFPRYAGTRMTTNSAFTRPVPVGLSTT